MKKLQLLLALLSVTLLAQAQDTTKKKEVVIAIPRTDTLPKLITYGDASGTVKYTYGFIVLSGNVVKENGKWFWVEQPKVTLFLDDKKKPLKKVIQYFDLK